jgi:hypothetical protein
LILLIRSFSSLWNTRYHGIATIRSADLTCRDDQLVGMNGDASVKETEYMELMASFIDIISHDNSLLRMQ